MEYCKPNVQILDRDNIGLIALLTPNTTLKSKRNKRDSSNSIHEEPYICVATTHLLYNPNRYYSVVNHDKFYFELKKRTFLFHSHDIKLAQLQMLFAELDHIAYHQSGSSSTKSQVYHPVILTGDFNLTPDTSAYQFITKGTLQYEVSVKRLIYLMSLSDLFVLLFSGIGKRSESQFSWPGPE